MINSGGQLGNGGFDVNLNGDLINNSTSAGDVDLTGGIITFQGGSAQVMGGSQKFSMDDLVINNTGGVTVTSSANIDLFTLTVTAGGFTSGSGLITIINATSHGKIIVDITAASDFTSGGFVFQGNRRSVFRSDRDLAFNSITLNATAATSLGNGAVDFRSNNGTTRTFTINGTFTRTSGEPTVGGSVSQPVSIAFASTGKLTYNGGSLTVSNEWPTSAAVAPSEVRFSPSSTTTYTINTSAYPVRSGGAVIVDGTAANPTINGTGSISYASGAGLVFNGSFAHTVGIEWGSLQSIDSVRVNNSAGVTVSSGSRYVNKVLVLNSGELKQPTAGDSLYLGGSLVGGLSGGGAYDTTAKNGIMVFNGSSNQTITGSSTLANIYVNKPYGTTALDSTVDLGASAVTVNKTIVVNRGRFLNSLGTLTVNNEGGSGITLNNASRFEMGTGANNLTLPALTANGTSRVLTGGKTFFGHTGGQPVFTLATASAFIFNGTSGTETLPTTITSFGILRISNSNGVNMSSTDITVDSLDFTSGILVQEGNGTLTVRSSGGYNSTRFVAGALRVTVTDNSNHLFPVGVQTDTKYRPAVFKYNDFTGGSNAVIEVKYFNADPTGVKPTGVSTISSTAYYTIK
ncbi:hypothetical protein KDA23_05465, partial [Candidatus Saccharibacteria bacterium]|nr:hypothetical protein [Candidatus Saccharibacteria bacterium]